MQTQTEGPANRDLLRNAKRCKEPPIDYFQTARRSRACSNRVFSSASYCFLSSGLSKSQASNDRFDNP